MNPVVDKILRWSGEGERSALAAVVGVERSAPLGPGASMAVSEDGQVVGSVGGGCVGPAVYEEAFGVGLTCGGVVHIFVERADW